MEPSTFRLPPETYVLSMENFTRLALLYNGLVASIENALQQERETLKLKGKPYSHIDPKFGRRKAAEWIGDELYKLDYVVKTESGKIVWRNDLEENDSHGEDQSYCIDRVFNFDGSFRWLSKLSEYATQPPQRNQLRRIAWRIEVITTAFIASGLYTPEIEGWHNPFAA